MVVIVPLHFSLPRETVTAETQGNPFGNLVGVSVVDVLLPSMVMKLLICICTICSTSNQAPVGHSRIARDPSRRQRWRHTKTKNDARFPNRPSSTSLLF